MHAPDQTDLWLQLLHCVFNLAAPGLTYSDLDYERFS
jgi:hypothetical protein